MLNTELLVDFFRHMGWADAAVWTSVLASAEARGDVKLREYLYHLHLAQWAFLRTWRGEPPDTPYPTFEELPPLADWGRRYHHELVEHVSTLDDRKLSEPMPLPWAGMVEKRLGRRPEMTRVGETAMQVVFHSTYHRGQINARLRIVGGTPPLVDYIGWLWLGRPAAEWPRAGEQGSPEQQQPQ